MKLTLDQIIENITEDRDLWKRNHDGVDILTEKGKDYAKGRIEAANYVLSMLKELGPQN